MHWAVAVWYKLDAPIACCNGSEPSLSFIDLVREKKLFLPTPLKVTLMNSAADLEKAWAASRQRFPPKFNLYNGHLKSPLQEKKKYSLLQK